MTRRRTTMLAFLAITLAGCKPDTPTSILLELENATQIIPTSLDIKVWNTHGLAYDKHAFPSDGGALPSPGKDGLLGTVLIHATAKDDELRIVVTGHAGSTVDIQGVQTVAVVEGSQITATIQLREGLMSDLDRDGVPDSIDNCPMTYNPGQDNVHGTGDGDECANAGLDAGADGPPPAGNALKFDGIDDAIPLPRIVKDSFTIEFWMNTDCAGDSRIIDATSPGGTKGFSVGIAGGKAVYSVAGNPACTSFTTVTGGKWVHIAAIRNAGEAQARLAINGGIEPTCSGGTASLTDVTDMIVGGGGTAPYCGQIDELRLWDVARTNQELTADKGRILTGTEPNLVGYWRFDEQPRSTVLLSSVTAVENQQIQSVDAARRPTWVISTAPLQ